MISGSVFSSTPFQHEKLSERYVAIYPISKSNHQYIFFSRNRLYLMYHLLRFGYFDRGIIDNIYYTLSIKNSLTKQWLQSLIGGRGHPISEYTDFKDGKRKIYYINKSFASWLLDEIQKHKDIVQDLLVTEYDGSLHSISTNNIRGGKPKSVNHHDLVTRRIASDCSRAVVQATTLEIQKPQEQPLNIQFSFPTNRVVSNILPDATLFVNGVPFYIEYDNGTEKQWKLQSKILRYMSNPEFRNAAIFFVFKVANKRVISKRITTFLSNIEHSVFDGNSVLSIITRAGISIYGYPIINATKQISVSIVNSMDLASPQPLTVGKLNGGSSFPYEAEAVTIPHLENDFLYFVDVLNEYYESETIPVLSIEYGKAGNETLLREIYDRYHSSYDHIALLFTASVSEQFQEFDYGGYYIPIYFDESEDLN